MAILEVSGLCKSFGARRRRGGAETVRAVDDVSFDLERQETLAIVGESGAGKSTAGRLVLRLIEPDEGSIVFDGSDVTALGHKEMRALRQRMQMVFQDPYSCLDPRLPIWESVAEPLRVHFGTRARERRERAAEALSHVELGSHFLDRLPHELSGGQLQRAAIARALTLRPDVIVCDEPVAALDVSVRAQVINLLSDLQDEFGISYLFICHDLALVEVIADRVAVMRSGRILELGETSKLFADPQHDYTRQLLAAAPTLPEFSIS